MRGSNKAMSRMENAPSRIEIARMMAAITELFCASYRRPPSAIVLDIDDTLDRVRRRTFNSGARTGKRTCDSVHEPAEAAPGLSQTGDRIIGFEGSRR